MPVLRDARSGTHDHDRKFLLAQTVQSGFDGPRVVGGNGIAIGGLIAGRNQTIERQGIIFRSDPLLFEQTAEDSRLNGG